VTRPRFNPITFFQELRRRRVFRVAVLYAVGAWGVIAACDVLFPQLTDWVADPDRAMRAVFIAAILLFPVALVFGWLYDVTPEGIRRTANFSETAHDPDTSLHPVDRGVIGTLSVLVIAVLALTSVHIVRMPPVSLAGSPGASIAPENSIAVLPFEICEGPGVDPLLAAGIANEVLRHLAEIPNLKVTARSLLVIARASAFAFAETDMEPQQIAATLKVHYLLTGTVCRDGDALTVKAELVDESGYLVWSDSYTEQLDAAGQVTRSVAALLAEGVASRLGAVMQGSEDEPVDRLAYEQLLIGREYVERNDQDNARAAFEAALERKPDYAEAMFELALLEWPNVFMDSEQKAQYEKSILLAERALAMARRDLQRDPNSAHSHYVVGRITWMLMRLERHLALHKSGPDNPDVRAGKLAEAEGHLRRAVELNPSDSDAWYHLYLAFEEAEQEQEALAVLEQGIERDPLNAAINGQLAIQWARRGRYNEAIALLDRFKQLPDVPDGIWVQMLRVNTLRSREDLGFQSVVEMLEHDGYPEHVRRGQGASIWVAYTGYLLRRLWDLTEESKAWLTSLQEIPGRASMPDYWVSEEEVLARAFEQASRMSDEEILDQGLFASGPIVEALRRHGDYKRAVRLMEATARERLFPSIRTWAPGGKLALATMYLEAGREEDAAVVLDELSRLLEAMVGEGLTNSVTLELLALTQALQGRVDAAISTLELSEASGNAMVFNCHHPEEFSGALDPFAALRTDLRFQKLHERCMAEFERQRAAVRTLLAEHGIDKLLAPWIEVIQEEKAKKQAAEKASN